MRKLMLLILMLVPMAMAAQPTKKTVPEKDFTRFYSNRLVFKGDCSAFDKFFTKMDSVCLMGQGKLRIMHIGGSHVQGGTLTREFRNDLLSIRPGLDGGRGMVFPYSVAKTNTPSDYRSKGEGTWTSTKNTHKGDLSHVLGLTGIAVSTIDTSAAVKIVLQPKGPLPEDPEFSFNDVTVLGYSTGDMHPVIVQAPGDTITGTLNASDSCWNFKLPAPSDSVKVALAGKGGEFTLTGIYLDRPSSGITVNGIGVNGASTVSYRKCLDFERDLKIIDPDLVIFAIGINDATGSGFDEEVFKERYRSIIEKIRAVNPDCALLFVTNNDSFKHTRRRGYYVNPNGVKVEHAFQELGEECGGAVWDLFDIMGGLGSMKKWELAGLARRDKVHFTDEGYKLLGDLLYNALMDKYLEHLTTIR